MTRRYQRVSCKLQTSNFEMQMSESVELSGTSRIVRNARFDAEHMTLTLDMQAGDDVEDIAAVAAMDARAGG